MKTAIILVHYHQHDRYKRIMARLSQQSTNPFCPAYKFAGDWQCGMHVVVPSTANDKTGKCQVNQPGYMRETAA